MFEAKVRVATTAGRDRHSGMLFFLYLTLSFAEGRGGNRLFACVVLGFSWKQSHCQGNGPGREEECLGQEWQNGWRRRHYAKNEVAAEAERWKEKNGGRCPREKSRQSQSRSPDGGGESPLDAAVGPTLASTFRS